ncbi:NAD(P)H-binding protein [Actinoallomurus sp. CA-150999]|uniref:NmrA family NAD(P)-binding protein n=1 Tax=Actinoallomurus sp. CA-150999 TaxID=3239887 RepID=UPI003D9372C0
MMILVTGATGNVGRPLVGILADAGVPVRAVTRTPHTASLPDGVDVVRADPSDPGTLAVALDDVDAVFINPRAVGHAAAALVALAEKRDVRRAVVLAASNVDEDPARQPSRYRGDYNREAEQAVTASGMEWVSLRPTTFAGNVIGLWAAQIGAGDVIRGPYARAAAAPIDERDIAEVAAHALRRDDLLGERLEVTGPASLTQEEMVAIVGTAIGRPLRYQEVPPEVARQIMVAQGFPEQFAVAYLRMQADAARQPARTTQVVTEVLGRDAGTFASWAERHREAFLAASGPRVPGGRR